MHLVIAIAVKLGAKRAKPDLALALEDPNRFVAKHRKRLADRGITKPNKALPWVALVEALADEKLVAELDHRTFPEDVADALDALRTMPKRRGRWDWVGDIDEGTATSDFLSLVAHHMKLSLVEIDLDSDSIPIAIVQPNDVAALVKLGCTAIKPRAELSKPRTMAVSDAKVIAKEDREPWAEARWVIAGTKRGDEIFGVHYDEPYLKYAFYTEWRGRLGYEKTDCMTRAGFRSRSAAVAAAERELADRVAKGWRRVPRARRLELHEAVKRR